MLGYTELTLSGATRPPHLCNHWAKWRTPSPAAANQHLLARDKHLWDPVGTLCSTHQSSACSLWQGMDALNSATLRANNPHSVQHIQPCLATDLCPLAKTCLYQVPSGSSLSQLSGAV